MQIEVPIRPELDPDFVPAALWNQAYREQARSAGPREASIALLRADDTGSVFTTPLLPAGPENAPLSIRYLERLLKFLLWQRGACRVLISGCDELTTQLAATYATDGVRAFDNDFFGPKLYSKPFSIETCAPEAMPAPSERTIPLGRHLDGNRIGFDLGGSDRKCAAVIDGEVVFSEEIEWNPYFESNPDYHIEGINDSLKRAAEHLPRVDAIGGSAAGVYVNNEVRIASLFRGVSPEDFDKRVRRLFFDLKTRWNDVPFEVVNDGEVTALAGSMSMEENAVLGIAMGTSLAAGYVAPDGTITSWLNELAFAPVDYRDGAPADEWSGDLGCGVQYFSQQGVARLAPKAGLVFPADMPFPEQLIKVQEHMEEGDERAGGIYRTIGTCFGYSIAHYADFYDIRKILLLGRVTSGAGGGVIIDKATETLHQVFPELASQVEICTPDEKNKRHGQAIAAASLPALA